MLAIKFDGCNVTYKAPVDWDESIHGPCGDLPVQKTEHTVRSIWIPSPEELEVLKRGGGIVLDIYAQNQPVISVNVADIDYTEAVVESAPAKHGAVETDPADIIEPLSGVIDSTKTTN